MVIQDIYGTFIQIGNVEDNHHQKELSLTVSSQAYINKAQANQIIKALQDKFSDDMSDKDHEIMAQHEASGGYE